MGNRPTKVPSIPAIGPAPDVAKVLGALKESVEIAHGQRGDPLDSFVSFRDLGDAGIANVNVKSGVGGNAVSISAPTATPTEPPGATTFKPGDPDFGDTNFKKPPAPTGVTAKGLGPTSIAVLWNPPDFVNFSHAELFCVNGTSLTQASAALDTTDSGRCNFNQPILGANTHSKYCGLSYGTQFIHSGLAPIVLAGVDNLTAALQPVPRFYFVRFISTAGVPGPYSPLNGASGTLALDPQAVLAALTANVTDSSIYKSLVGTYIDPGVFSNITAAGGLYGYLNSQTTLLHGAINQQLIHLIGASDTGGTSVYARLDTLQATANAQSASIGEVNQWQAALSVATGSGAGTAAVASISTVTNLGSTIVWGLLGSSTPVLPFTIGRTLRIVSNGNPSFASVNGKLVTITAVSSNGSNASGIYTPLVTTDGATIPTPGGVLSPSLTLTTDASPASNFVDFMAGVYSSVWANVDSNSAVGRALLTSQAQLGTLTSTVTQVNQAVTNLNGTMSGLWSVQMQQVGQSGIFASAGFGLSLDTTKTADGKYIQSSTFAINANQFAIMGPSAASGAVIRYMTASGQTATLNLTTPNHGFVAGGQAVFLIQNQGYRDSVTSVTKANPFAALALGGLTCNVTSVSGANVTVQRTDSGSFSSSIGSDSAPVDKFNNALMPAQNIPFIVDTTKNVVGIRGNLVVNGLISADSATIASLYVSGTAFVNQLYANVLNANLIVGQRIIAGAPGSGVYSGGPSISNYIIELNNPLSPNGAYPLNYYNPSTGAQSFFVDRNGNMGVGGNMSVGGNAVISTTGPYVASIGGAGADGNYVLWIGDAGVYGVNGAGRAENNALLWAKDNGRVGINASVFLGDFPLQAPTADGNVIVPASRSGGPATVFVSGNVGVLGASDGSSSGSETQLGAMLMLVSTSVAGSPGSLRAGIGTISDLSIISSHVICDQSAPTDNPPNIPSGVIVSQSQFDGKGMDIKNISLQGAVTVPAGSYKALMYVWRKSHDANGNLACFNANFFAALVR